MDRFGKLLALLLKEHKYSRKWRIFATTMAGVVVFVTTYSLILPAITIDYNTAVNTAGMDLLVDDDSYEISQSWDQGDSVLTDELQVDDDLSWNDAADAASIGNQNNGSDELEDILIDDEALTEDMDDLLIDDDSWGMTDPDDDLRQEGMKNPVYRPYAYDQADGHGSDIHGDHEAGYERAEKTTFGIEIDVPALSDEKLETVMEEPETENEAVNENETEEGIEEGEEGEEGEEEEGIEAVTETQTVTEKEEAETITDARAEKLTEKETETVIENMIEAVTEEESETISEEESETISEEETETVEEEETETILEEETEEISEAETEFLPEKTFDEETGNVQIHVAADEGAFPEGTTMTVTDIEDEETISAIEESVEQTVMKIHAVDIAFQNADGEEIEPLIPIRVTMTAKKPVKTDEEAFVVHVDDDGQTDPVDEVNVSEKTGEVDFEAEAFSVYALVYTVDFHYQANGKQFDFGIPGGGFVSLKQIVEALNIAELHPREISEDASPDEAVNSFVSEVACIDFSDPELIWTGKAEMAKSVGELIRENQLEIQYSEELTEEQKIQFDGQIVEEGDWALISLKPFTSEETLTITMKNGDQFAILVTDAQITQLSQIQQNTPYIVYVRKGNDYYALQPVINGQNSYIQPVRIEIPAGWTLENVLQQMPAEYNWTFEKNFYKLDFQYDDFTMRPVSNRGYSVALFGGLRLDTNRNDFGIYKSGNGFTFQGWSHGGGETLYLNDQMQFVGSDGGAQKSTVYIYEKDYKQDIDNGQYAIVYKSGDKYYALANNGSTVEVEYDPQKNEVTNTRSSSLIWNWNFNHIDNGVYYVIREEKAYTTYVHPHDGSTTQNQWSECDVQKVSENNYNLRGRDGQYLGWNGHAFTGSNDSPADFFLAKVVEPAMQYKLTVTVNDPSWGSVSGTDGKGKPTGETSRFETHSEDVNPRDMTAVYNFADKPVTAIPKDGYLFDHWEINNSRFEGDTDWTLMGSFLLYGDAELKAVFKKDTTVKDEMTKEEIESQLEAWARDMLSDKVTVNKTAQVSDYENRIYEISMSASSGVRRVMPTLDLEFITDVSRSMFFPATLEEVGTFTQGTKATGQYNSRFGWAFDTSDQTLWNWLDAHKNDGEIYYVVGDDSAATVTALYYGGSAINPKDGVQDSNWRKIDSSNLNPPDTWKDPSQSKKGNIIVRNGGSYDIYNAPLTGKIYRQVGTLRRMDYLKMAAEAAAEVLYGVDPNARIGLVTFAADAYDSHFYTQNGTDSNGRTFEQALEGVDLKGGTDQGDGLIKGRSLFEGDPRKEANPIPERVAILITDGAPNQSDTGWDTKITQAATNLKRMYNDAWTSADPNSRNYQPDSVTLFTLGLSMDMVGESNRAGLKSIATGGASGNRWKEANNGAAIVEAIKQLIREIVDEASLKGDVSDTIDEVFHPVTSDGTPLKAGQMIDLSGNYIYSVPEDGKYGTVGFNGKNYSVRWNNQTIAYREDGSPSWVGKIYVKAKEDYFGGNTVNTNKGTDDAFHPKKYIVNGKEYNLHTGDDEKLKRSFTTPYVNVDELSLTQNSTEWTVYLGTEIMPEEQLRALFDEIRVREVVSGSTNHMITDRGAMLGSSKSEKSEEFPLRDGFPNLSDAQWNSRWNDLLRDGTVTMDYSAYGHASGKVRLSLVKIGETADYDKHKAMVPGERVERYILTAEYIPDDPQNIPYQTTPGGTPGIPTGNMESSNLHVVNVFEKGLNLIKVDMVTGEMIDPAEFTLSGPGKEDIVKTTVNSEVSFDPLEKPQAKAGGGYENYTLRETKAPDGYTLMDEALVVNLNLKDQYTDPKTGKVLKDGSGKELIAPPQSGLYNLVETANLVVGGKNTGFFERVNEEGSPDSKTVSISYKIRNNPGVALPNTGGPGTLQTYLSGILLTVFGAAGMVLKNKRRIRR